MYFILFLRIMAEQRMVLTPPAAPAMPTAAYQVSSSGSTNLPPHQENVQTVGYVSNEWFALVHTPVSIQKAKSSPEGRAALEKEWKKLEDKHAWDLKSVRERAAVIKEATSKHTTVHFWRLDAAMPYQAQRIS